MQTADFTIRYQVMDVFTADAFMRVKGSLQHGCKDVYFLRVTEINETAMEEIQRMDQTLTNQMNQGRGFYNRLSSLPRLAAMKDTEFYTECYENWLRSGKKCAAVKASAQNQQLCRILGGACREILGLLEKGKKGMNASIEKNFLVKVFYWLDQTVFSALQSWKPESSRKVVCMDISRQQEYLFCYLLTLLGFDVLLLQMNQDISQELEQLGLSCKCAAPRKRVPVNVRVPERDRRTREMLDSRKKPETSVGPGNGRDAVGRQNVSHGGSSEIRQNVSHGGGSEIRQNVSHGGSSEIRRSPQAERSERTYEELAQLASSVVQIMIHDSRGDVIGGGSGIMVGREGYILTNNHVACRGRLYSVRIEEDERVYQTDEMIKYNSVLDLAVLRIDRNLQPLPIYQGEKKLVRGQRVVAIGSPLGLFNSVSDGIISGFRSVEGVDMIQFTAPISNGSSGGAVLNMYGEVIGISTAGFDAGQNINLAVGYEYIGNFIRGFVN